jgi:hypothetical protein
MPEMGFKAGAPRKADIDYWQSINCGIQYACDLAPAQAAINELRAEVERLTRERDEAQARVAAMEGETTVPDNMQEWARLDGAIAWHLIERHADSWAAVGKMMDEFIAAKIATLRAARTDTHELMALADAYARACVRDEMATVKCEGMTAEEEAERVMHAAREALRTALDGRKEEL